MSGAGVSGVGGDSSSYVDDADGGDGTSMDSSRDIAHVKAILEEAGVTDYDPRVVHLLLDLLYTTTSGLLTQAKAISQHCGKMVIDEPDVQIAADFSATAGLSTSMRACCRVEDNVAHQFKMMVFVCISGILSDGTRNRAEALKQAADRNAQPLPQIRHNFGLKLPNDRFCLLQPNVEWRGSERSTADLLSNNAPLTVGQPPASSAYVDDSLQQLRPEHVTNILKRPHEDDFDV
ncbi:unnamed protein product [Heligmosomoides polygyrus]|uniref:Transcription initiation factor TFIID subunit 10 n=1 Tax=Heligmosomoides polygyrus TaxID=6339 RepID=A0A183FH39_HELPZ|nr:unnamed protein product [Heligmosomoides polygyrus]